MELVKKKVHVLSKGEFDNAQYEHELRLGAKRNYKCHWGNIPKQNDEAIDKFIVWLQRKPARYDYFCSVILRARGLTTKMFMKNLTVAPKLPKQELKRQIIVLPKATKLESNC